MAYVKNSKEIRFIFVGTAAFLIQFLLTWFLLSIGLRAALSVGGAFMVAFTVAYLAHKYWTFSSSVPHHRALPKYFAAQMLALSFSACIAELSAGLLLFPNGLTAVLATVGSALISFYLSSRWVFTQ
ncbi:MAG: GtrA family protein [Moraxellaceae bacterium]|nr:GtrA family protein [Moraxellaceae bacterium]MDZ4387606.1 GtrA family protein [Moraxellaceae bacterium]